MLWLLLLLAGTEAAVVVAVAVAPRLPGGGQFGGEKGAKFGEDRDLLAQLGFEVVTVTGKPEQAGYLKELGAASVVAAADLPAVARVLTDAGLLRREDGRS